MYTILKILFSRKPNFSLESKEAISDVESLTVKFLLIKIFKSPILAFSQYEIAAGLMSAGWFNSINISVAISVVRIAIIVITLLF
jgi:hypothetical protein